MEEMLKELGYTDDQIKAIMEGMKKKNLFISAEENIDTRYQKLKEQHDSKNTELENANKLIKSLQESAKTNDVEGMKTKISEYEKENAELKEQLKKTQIQSQLALELKEAGVTDESYIAFKIEQKLKADKKEFELTDDGKIKGLKELIESEKKISPSFFKSEQKKEVDVKDLGKEKEQDNAEPKDFKEAVMNKYNEKMNKNEL